MQIDILTVLPEIFEGPLNNSIIERAKKSKLVKINIYNLRDFSEDKHKRVDDYPYSGGGGMVMKIEPIYKAIKELSKKKKYNEIIYTSPDGEKLNQGVANHLSTFESLLIVCGHYKGIDQRVRDHLITKEISIGDYVLTGGELAAAVITDNNVRLLPLAISDEMSALSYSFQDNLLAPPLYTRPENFKGWKVPDILLSGDAKAIENWKMEKALERTQKLRPELLNDESD